MGSCYRLSFPSTKVHISHKETSSRTPRGSEETGTASFILGVWPGFCKKLTFVKVCYELWTIFCALHILIKRECGCKSSRQSEASSGCASNYPNLLVSPPWKGWRHCPNLPGTLGGDRLTSHNIKVTRGFKKKNDLYLTLSRREPPNERSSQK